MSGRGRRQDRDGPGEGTSGGPGTTEGASGAVLEILLEQQRAQQEQQRMLMALLEQQKEELAEHRREMAELRTRKDNPDGGGQVRLPKPTLQKLGPEDDIEHFLSTFERIATQQGWPGEVWATQLAGLLTGKALAAYAGLSGEKAASYDEVKAAVLHRFDVNEETYRRRFRSDRKKPEESYQNWGSRLNDHFTQWTKDQPMAVEELMVLDQFLHGVPEDLRVWLKERRPGSLQQAMKLADDYALARGGSRPTQQRPSGKGTPPVTQSMGKPEENVPQVAPSRLPTPGGLERSRTNARGERRCFQCGTYGHIAVNCPSRGESSTTTGTTKGLYATAGRCDEVAWNAGSRKYLRRGTLEGQPARILVDTGCDRTMISAGRVLSSKVDHSSVVPILCVHGDTMQYPTAWVELQVGQWRERCHVVVAPNLPVDVLLGTDVYPMERVEAKQSLAVWTRSKRRQMERELAGVPQLKKQ